jgi:acyl carrier protein
MEQVLDILRGLRPDVDFDRETALIDDGILSSFDITSLVNELMEEFNVVLNMADLEPENFNSAQAIWDFIRSLKG